MGAHDTCDVHGPRLSWWELWPMLGWGVFVVQLYWRGRMSLFLQPIYATAALVGGIVLLAAFVGGWVVRRLQLRRAARECEHDEHTHEHDGAEAGPGCLCHTSPGGWGAAIRSLAFLVPLVIGFALPERGLNALAALQRGAGEASMQDSALIAQLAAKAASAKEEQKRGFPWVPLTSAADRLSRGQAGQIGTLGFVARPKGMPPDRFLLVRFVATCCAADATPVAVTVIWPDAHTLPSDQWVEVYGRLEPGRKALVAEIVEPAKQPPNPYL